MTHNRGRSQTFHATTVAVDGRGLIILGASGRGKSSLALQLIALGADLVADDRTMITLNGNVLVANSPTAIKGKIEARGIGVLTLPCVSDIPIYLAIDLDDDETERLPHPHAVDLMGTSVPCLRRCQGPHEAAALFLYLRVMKQPHDE